MIVFSAMAIDNGFRVVVVLTSNYLKLVEQTADRFRALEGPIVEDSTGIDRWLPDADHVRDVMGSQGLLVVCAKDPQHLSTLVQFFDRVGAGGYPALVLDDEADQATPDTTVRSRATGRGGTSSTIHRRTIRNDAEWEEGQSLRQRLPHNVFVQVTATPYALLLQNSDHPLRPGFTMLLEPGPGYTGGEAFFDQAHVETEQPPIIFVPEEESDAVVHDDEVPQGLARALSFFVVSACANQLIHPSARMEGRNFLCHTSARTSEHDRVADLIRRFVGELLSDLRQGFATSPRSLLLDWAHHELQKTCPDLPPLAAVLELAADRLARRRMYVVNSASSDVSFDRDLNFIVGGNILGRGLTIDNLLVTYYLRKARVSQMDTMLQHARMFGYRQSLMPFTRVFLPEVLAVRFHRIHVAERTLRSLIATHKEGQPLPVQVSQGLRATRANVLDPNYLSAYSPGEQVYPSVPILKEPDQRRCGERLRQLMKTSMDDSIRDRSFVPVEIRTIVDALDAFPVDKDDAGNWDPDVLKQVLESLGGTGLLLHRTMRRTTKRFPTGAASGDERAQAIESGVPVLFVFKDDGRQVVSFDFWYPTLVLPSTMTTQVFNTSE